MVEWEVLADMGRFFPRTLNILVWVLFSIIGCNKGGGFQTSEHLADSPLLADTSKRTLAVVAVGDLPAGSLGVSAEEAAGIFSRLSGLSGLRELLGLISALQSNGTLGAEYSSAALTFSVVDGTRVVSLGFAGRGDLSVDLMSTVNSTARSNGLEVEAISQAESRISRSLETGDYVSISVSGRVLKFRHAVNGAWPEPNAEVFGGILKKLRGTEGLMGISFFALGEFGKVFGAASPLPWSPREGSTLIMETRILEDGRQTVSANFVIPGLKEALGKCSGVKGDSLGFNSVGSHAPDDAAYEVRLNPVISCVLGAETPGFVQLRWKVTPPTEFQMLIPFKEREVLSNLPDTWPAGAKPKAEYLAGCGGVVVYSGVAPNCGPIGGKSDAVFIRAPFDFIKRLLVGVPPDAEEFFRLLRLYQGDFVEVRGQVSGDDLVLSIG